MTRHELARLALAGLSAEELQLALFEARFEMERRAAEHRVADLMELYVDRPTLGYYLRQKVT